MATRRIEIAPGVSVEVNENPLDSRNFFPTPPGPPSPDPVGGKARATRNKARGGADDDARP